MEPPLPKIPLLAAPTTVGVGKLLEGDEEDGVGFWALGLKGRVSKRREPRVRDN